MRRVIAISDLHLGGGEPPMLGKPDLLVGFLESLAEYHAGPNESIELVIHGDFVDFLAEEPWQAWTLNQNQAGEKLKQILQKRVPEVTKALARCIRNLARFTLLLGNHDVELALPAVRDDLFRMLETDAHRAAFLYNNEAYRCGELLIEHGNRYDPWNRVDHDGLRQTVSALSRGEPVDERWVAACPGSQLVVHAMNPLKERYPFIDLLKPEDKLIAILIPQIEPQAERLLPSLFQYERANLTRHIKRVLPAAMGRKYIAAESPFSEAQLPADVESAERQILIAQTNHARSLPPESVIPTLKLDSETRPFLACDEGPLTSDAVYRLQKKLRHALCNDHTFDRSDPGEPGTAVRACYDAAEAILHRQGVRVVIMGHTHLRREIGLAGGRYLNTGTWVDLIRVDESALVETEAGRAALNDWWGKLVSNQPGIRFQEPTFADVRLTAEGKVIEDGRPLLRRFEGGRFE